MVARLTFDAAAPGRAWADVAIVGDEAAVQPHLKNLIGVGATNASRRGLVRFQTSWQIRHSSINRSDGGT